MKRTPARRATASTVATALVAIGLTLALAASNSGCTNRAAASFTASTPAPIASAVKGITDMTPEPPFDTTPITPVESVGASRTE